MSKIFDGCFQYIHTRTQWALFCEFETSDSQRISLFVRSLLSSVPRKKMYLLFFTTNIVIDVAVKFEISSFSRNQAKNMREIKNSNNNNSATEWWGKKMCVWWTECVVNGWDDMHTVHHCVINKIQINVKSPESPKLTTATTEKDEERWEEVFPYYITIGRALALSAVHVLLLWPTSSDKNGTNDKEKNRRPITENTTTNSNNNKYNMFRCVLYLNDEDNIT